MKHTISTLSFVLFLIILAGCSKYKYETVNGDPTQTRIYTLNNGLKVYLTQNFDEPRIQTYIAVKVGAKNDPLETTGLAHYFEHLMFKGTKNFGTQNYAEEKPLLDKIEELFETYRKETDSTKRTAIYAEIDSISQEASKIAIPNEYDKLMAAIGSEGTNAWTSFDETCYTENIPSNQIENWATIQADRFQNEIIRGFHTELETIYEEYNMSLTRDSQKELYKLLEKLYPSHPYGMHSVLGKQEHLKNPSITNVKNYYKTYYVPNNMAICMSGDLDFDNTISIIDKYFGALAPNNNLPKWEIPEDKPINGIITEDVYGLEAENIILGWNAPRASDKDAVMVSLLSSIMSNGKCGLVDIDINQSQKLLGADASYETFADKGMFLMMGFPKEGQTLEEVRDILLQEIKKLRDGDFDETLISSAISNYKLGQMRSLESNSGRARAFVEAFINGIKWEDVVSEIDNASKVTKEQVIAWANENLSDNNFVAIYKRKGIDSNEKKIDKPHITPIATNREMSSAFLDSIQKVEVAPITPVFIDYSKDMSITSMKSDISVLYKQNTTNDIFNLSYIYETGSNTDPALDLAVSDYLSLIGTNNKSLKEIQKELYSLACSFHISVEGARTTVNISGLSENMSKTIDIVEDYLANVKGDETILQELKKDIIKAREDSKLNQRSNYSALQRYARYGKDIIKKITLDNDQLSEITSDELISKINSLRSMTHRISYYGPLSKDDITSVLNEHHNVAESLITPEYQVLPYQTTETNKVIFAQYNAKQIYYQQYSCNGEKFDVTLDAPKNLFNSYFGGGMNAIVFQEMREARGLAYSASASYTDGSRSTTPYIFTAFIATQNDKVRQAVEAFEDIIENMPVSEHAFQIAKQSILTSIETSRTTKANVLRSWIRAQDLGLNCDRSKAVYEKIKDMTLDDVIKFHQDHIKGRKYHYLILGDENDLDMKYVKSLGEFEKVSQKDIFGY